MPLAASESILAVLPIFHEILHIYFAEHLFYPFLIRYFCIRSAIFSMKAYNSKINSIPLGLLTYEPTKIVNATLAFATVLTFDLVAIAILISYKLYSGRAHSSDTERSIQTKATLRYRKRKKDSNLDGLVLKPSNQATGLQDTRIDKVANISTTGRAHESNDNESFGERTEQSPGSAQAKDRDTQVMPDHNSSMHRWPTFALDSGKRGRILTASGRPTHADSHHMHPALRISPIMSNIQELPSVKIPSPSGAHLFGGTRNYF